MSTIVSADQTQYNISNLAAFTRYNIFVEAVGINNLIGMPSTVMSERTNSTTTPILPPPTIQTPSPTANTFVFNLPPATFPTGPLK